MRFLFRLLANTAILALVGLGLYFFMPDMMRAVGQTLWSMFGFWVFLIILPIVIPRRR